MLSKIMKHLSRVVLRRKTHFSPILCTLYKDVGGVFTADPHIVPEARLISEISYEEMMEMGSQGAKVIHPRAVEIAQQYGVAIFVTSMANPYRGTLITQWD